MTRMVSDNYISTCRQREELKEKVRKLLLAYSSS